MANTAFNFSPGPAVLPRAVLEEAQRHLLALPGARFSVLEISHRSQAAGEILGEAEENLRRLLGVPEPYRVLFLQGGASLQFSMVPINFLRGSEHSADYVVTGSWAKKALGEAKKEGRARACWNGAESGFRRVPATEELDLDPRSAYVHFTSNETIEGVQFAAEPDPAGVPLICDMSSDFLSRPIDVRRYALVYAGAQKNAGPAGVTIVIASPELLDRASANLPALLDYRLLAETKSVYNTPPLFAIYIVLLVTRWLDREIGGLERMQALNEAKATLLYEALDRSGGFYKGHAEPASRSRMNVTWRLASPELEQPFLDAAAAEGLFELKGHRAVGGIRASIYNAMPLEGAGALAQFMTDFQYRHG